MLSTYDEGVRLLTVRAFAIIWLGSPRGVVLSYVFFDELLWSLERWQDTSTMSWLIT